MPNQRNDPSLDDARSVVGRLAGIHDSMAEAMVGKTGKGRRVWCRECRATQPVNPAECLRSGWPLCCGHTMTIDPPEEW
jgi:hypothetical protein